MAEGENDEAKQVPKLAVVEDEPQEPAKSTVVDLPEIPTQPTQKKSAAQADTFTGAVKMAFIGAGQGGGRVAETFYSLGYRRVCAVNTTNQDLEALSVKHKLVIGKDKGGAGKDPEAGAAAARSSFEEVIDILKRSWGEDPEQLFVTVGGGGGSGTGSWSVILDAIKEYAKISNIEGPVEKRLGMILTLPKRSEGPRVQKNALGALEGALAKVAAGELSTLIVVDNAKIHELFPDESVKTFWGAANNSFARVLHTFNLLAAQNSEYATFDKADFKSILRSGLVIFGMANVDKWEGTDDISQAVRQNLKGSLLGDGFDFSQATTAGAIIVAHDDVLHAIPMSHLDYAFHAFTRALGNADLTLHSGIYSGKQPGMRIFSIVGGLKPPAERLAELQKLGK
jgi:cell division GTPase FtsZ